MKNNGANMAMGRGSEGSIGVHAVARGIEAAEFLSKYVKYAHMLEI